MPFPHHYKGPSVFLCQQNKLSPGHNWGGVARLALYFHSASPHRDYFWHYLLITISHSASGMLLDSRSPTGARFSSMLPPIGLPGSFRERVHSPTRRQPRRALFSVPLVYLLHVGAEDHATMMCQAGGWCVSAFLNDSSCYQAICRCRGPCYENHDESWGLTGFCCSRSLALCVCSGQKHPWQPVRLIRRRHL